jgi:polysaccharide export outer membrane protein
MEEPRRKSRRRLMGGAISALLMIAGCVASKPGPLQTPAAPSPYRIAAGDTLEVIVWHEEQVSSKVDVRPDGMITVPLAGDVRAAGLTPEELAAQIHGVLSRFIDSPNVVVRVAAMGSRRFFIIGNVRTPGMYDLRPGQTLIQALAVAGGFTQFADSGHVKIIRAGADPMEYDYNAIVRGRTPDVLVQRDDTIVVP